MNFTIFIFHSKTINAQPFVSVHYNFATKDGLSSSEVYFVFQDSRNYLWFGTDNGVSRYDGYKFRNFSIRHGLSDNVVFKIFEDSEGKIWFGTFSGKLSYFLNDSIYQFKYNSALADTFPKNALLNSFHVDRKGSVYLGLLSHGCFKISKDGVIEQLNPEYSYRTLSPSYYLMEIDSTLFGYISTDTPKDQNERIIFKNDGKILKSIFAIDKTRITRSNFITLKTRKDSRFIAVSKRMIIVDKDYNEQLLQTEKEILYLYEDQENEILLGQYKGGVSLLNRNSHPFSFLNDLSVTCILQDHEGGYWFTTLEKGIYYVPDNSIREFSQESSLGNIPANVISSDLKGQISVGFQNGSICFLSDTGYQIQNIVSVGLKYSTCQILDLIYEEPNKLWIGTVGDIIVTKYEREKSGTRELIPLPCPRLALVAGSVWGGSSIGLCRFDNQQLVYNSAESLNRLRINSLLHDSLNNFWIGSKNGLWKFENEKFWYFGNRHPLFKNEINVIQKFRQGLLLGTEGAGLVIWEKDTIFNISQNDGLPDESINSIFVGKNDDIWLATQDGITNVKINANNRSIKNISEIHGLAQQEISDILINGQDILMAERSGFKIIKNFSSTEKTILMPIYITGLQINHADTSIAEFIDLPHNMNSIAISYQAVSFKFNKTLKYKYRMLGLDSIWHSTPNPSVFFAALQPGNYLFEVTVNGYPDFIHKVASMGFSIHSPYWKTWWFILSLSIISVGLISSAIYMRIRQIVARAELLQQLNASQQMALSAQMNPHFIFNSLNSIQTYILQNKTEDSSKYLAKFAKLMRLVLDNSREQLISLDEELKALELYLELEVMRFKGKISYSIELNDSINQDEIKIPPLLLQPYVENAIWHGLMPKQENGTVRVVINKKNNHIECQISDDGIGRLKSTAINENRKIIRKSLGTSLTEKRVKLINSVHKIRIGASIEDVLDGDGKICGTKVKIVIPLLV